jgi:hypothetical protein
VSNGLDLPWSLAVASSQGNCSMFGYRWEKRGFAFVLLLQPIRHTGLATSQKRKWGGKLESMRNLGCSSRLRNPKSTAACTEG